MNALRRLVCAIFGHAAEARELSRTSWEEDTGVAVLVDTGPCLTCKREILRVELWRSGKLRTLSVAARPGMKRAGWLAPEQLPFNFEDLRPLPPEAHNLEALERGRERWKRRR